MPTPTSLHAAIAHFPPLYINMPKEAPTKVSKRASAKSEDGKRRSKKDKSGPKRGLSAYMFFSQEQRPKVKEENPDANFGAIGKILGERWKNMTDEEKAPYNAKAEEDKKRYEAEKAAASEQAAE
ncbi:hypothetical protein VTP01DRAFT_3974 [Rhizomucor pusillus]|uniref:uncharacterized protein n=1 Tax=Rhizomucor pusillus TaxID=4840 RepID=UPI003742168E